MAETDGQAVGQLATLFATTVAAVLVGGVEAEDRGEDVIAEGGFDLFGSLAGGVERADECAHAGAGDHVDGDVVLVEPLEDADLADGKGSTAGEGETNPRAPSRA